MDIAATLEAFYNKVDLLYLTDVIGIVAFAFAGVLIGIRMKCDPVGIFVLAFSTAFGGGIVRDLLIDRRPMYWIAFLRCWYQSRCQSWRALFARGSLRCGHRCFRRSLP